MQIKSQADQPNPFKDKAMKTVRGKMVKTCVSLSDIHIGSEDKDALSVACDFIAEEKPDLVVLNGDIIDAYDVSTFLKNPSKEGFLQGELQGARDLISFLRDVLRTSAEIVYVEGNHEDRLRKMVWSTPIIQKIMPGVSLKSLLELDKLKVLHIPYGQHYTHAGVVFTHGHKVSKNVGADNIVAYGSSGTSGHTHRLSQVHKRMGDRTFTWVESGCLCRLDPEYVLGIADWHQGFAFGTMSQSGQMMMRPMSISGSDVF